MDGQRAVTAAQWPPALRAACTRSAGVIRRSRVAGYLRGLTPARIGLVLLICTILRRCGLGGTS